MLATSSGRSPDDRVVVTPRRTMLAAASRRLAARVASRPAAALAPRCAARFMHGPSILNPSFEHPFLHDEAALRAFGPLQSAEDIVASWNDVPAPLELPAADDALAPLRAVKRTFQPSLVRRKRKHGFLKRLEDRHGRNILKRRRAKNRKRLSC